MAKTEQAIEKARAEIEALGWSVMENLRSDGMTHIVCTKDGSRRGWGLYHRTYAWTEAYQAITGKNWTELAGPEGE